ncbi:hypothetical protein Tco_0774285 [Tanacetum coccineum]|uniref:Uncharacterized protein n=1 Tax=Tanacetum coccineum TaxID=301880 RepID=A0ABQ4ZN71_9ASTR
MGPYNHSTPTFTNLPILDIGKFEQWKFRIQQYLQHEHWKQISEKRTKNQAKTDKTKHEMEKHGKVKVKSNPSQQKSKPKSTPSALRNRSHSKSHHQQQQAPPPVVEPFNLEEPIENPAPPLVPMDDNQTMAQLLQAPTEGYEDAIVIPEINANFG